MMTRYGRRSVLVASLGLVGVTAAPAWSRRRGFFARHGLPVGIQLYTLGPDASRDLEGTFARIAEIGFQTIELAGYHGKTPAALRAAADSAGLRFSSIHLPASARGRETGLDSDPARIASEMHILGIKDVVLPMVPMPLGGRPASGESVPAFIARIIAAGGADLWKRTASLLNVRGEALRREGLRLAYHNHNLEFATVDGRTGFDILMRETDPKLVGFEMDVGWVVAAGHDPVALLRRYPHRFRQMHVKDLLASTVPNFAMQQDPAEVGSGIIPWRTVLPAAYAAGVRQFYVEQEPPFSGSRLEAVAKSFAFLTEQL